MGLEYGTFAVGGVIYPLTESTAKSLLEDADPALYHLSAYLAAVLDRYMGGRLRTESAKEGLKLAATRRVLAYEPAPELTTDEREFPLLAVYRKSSVFQMQSLALQRVLSEFEFAYLLPELSQRQHEVLSPILRSVGAIFHRSLHRGQDPAYREGASVFTLAHLQAMRMLRCDYAGFNRKDEFTAHYRAVVGRIEVIERDIPVAQAFETFDGGNLTIDAVDATGTVDAAVVAHTHPPPTITSVSPATGTKAGGTTITITGTGFRPGTPVVVQLDNSVCVDATVIDETHVQAVTTAHAASPTFIADVFVTNVDGQSARLPAAFAFITP